MNRVLWFGFDILHTGKSQIATDVSCDFCLPTQSSMSLPGSKASEPPGGCGTSINQVHIVHHSKCTAHEVRLASKLSVSITHTSAQAYLVIPTLML